MSQNSPKLHRIVRIYFFTFMVIVLATNYFPLKAQHYPVRVNTIVTPPYSSRLSDYVESGYDRVQLLINPLDMNLVDYKVKVKLIIESLDGRVLIQTDPNYLPPPVYLNGGVTEFLTSYDIQALFDPKNLIFVNGITKNEYLVNKRLPENYYRIGFILLDYNRATLGGTSNEVSVSNFGYTMAGMFLNDPPILNLPQNGIKQTLFEPQQIVLQWTPRHKGSPNSAFSCEYVVRLYEAWNEGYSAAAIVQTQMPIFETVTNSNRYVYGIADPMLIPGKKYVWTIQARDAEGRDMFRNNGLSEAFMFTWGDACLPPANFKAVPVNGPGMELKWSTATGHTDYDIRYRIAGSDGEWYEQNSMLTNARISSLRYNTTYEVSVKSNCGIHSSDYTLPVIVKMSEEPEQTFMCGTAGDMAPVTSTTPITVLPQGAIFYAGGFECHVVEARATERGFSGTCYVVVPFYGFAKVLHTFENIRINLDLQMFSGKLLSVADTVKGNALMTRIDNALTPPGSGFNNKQVAQILGADTVIVLKDRIKNVEVNNQGQIVVTYNNGKEEILEVEEGTTAVISDRDGEQYYVDNGNVSKARDAIESAASSASQQVADAVKAKDQLSLVRFAPGDNMNFGFDSLVYPELRSQYMINTVHGQEYVLPYKSVATGAMDVVDASMPAGGFSASGLSFRINQTPVVALPTTGDNMRTVNVTPLMSGDEQVLEAVYMLTDTAGKKVEETLGQLNVVAYDKQVIKLYVVPVGKQVTYSQSTISSLINDIYAPAVVEWNIEWLKVFDSDAWDINSDKVFDDTDKDERMDYTPAMKALIRDYKNVNNNIDRQAVYVFLFDGAHRNNDLDGYMPFNKQFAFVFTDGMTTDANAVAHHIAHEIAHGTFNLRHTFSDKNAYYQSRSTTHNLMDYTTTDANGLNKYQWDLIHDPESVLFSWLQEEEEGEMVNILNILKNIRNANMKELTNIELYQDQCPNVCYKDVNLGDVKLDYLQINCTKEFEGSEIDENKKLSWSNLSMDFGQKLLIIPNEKALIYTETLKGDAIAYQFHQAKKSSMIPLDIETTDNLLFEFKILKKNKGDFEEYLYPKANYFLSNVNFTYQTEAVINGLDCHWCSNWDPCCNGDIERIKDKNGDLQCENGTYRKNNCCYETALYMVKQTGSNYGSKLNLSDYIVHLVNNDDCRDGVTSNVDISKDGTILKAKKLIKQNTPVIAGVFYEYNERPAKKKEPGNTTADGNWSPSNHFIVIVGYGIDKEGKEYFRFYDPASGNFGNDENNKLYFDTQTNFIKGKRTGDSQKKYVLTELRVP